MASTRDKRSTAGNRLSKVLNEEVEADDFYATTYGGFNEIENDDDYKSEEEGDDLVDSDFSIEENDEVISDQEDESGKKKRTGVTTKAYKDPKGVKTTGKAEKRKSEQSKAAKSDKKDSSKKVKVESREGLERVERKSSRKATVEKSAETAKKIKERSQVKKKIPLKKNEYVKPTQEELLKEAKITEQENIKSLERYQKMELEKKKCRIVKKVYTGPTIKYQSVSMPLIEEVKEIHSSSRTVSESEVSIDVVKTEDSDADAAAAPPAPVNGDVKMEIVPEVETAQVETDQNKQDDQRQKEEENKVEKDKALGPRCERTFITFSDEQTFKSSCPWGESKPQAAPSTKICPFTRQKAKYFDPVSQCPYNTIQAFKILRETYYMQLEKAITNGTVEGVDKEDLNKWMSWRQKEKENKLRRLSVLPQNVAQATTPTVVQTTTPVTATLPS